MDGAHHHHGDEICVGKFLKSHFLQHNTRISIIILKTRPLIGLGRCWSLEGAPISNLDSRVMKERVVMFFFIRTSESRFLEFKDDLIMILLSFLNLKRDQYEIHFAMTRFFIWDLVLSFWLVNNFNQSEHIECQWIVISHFEFNLSRNGIFKT